MVCPITQGDHKKENWPWTSRRLETPRNTAGRRTCILVVVSARLQVSMVQWQDARRRYMTYHRSESHHRQSCLSRHPLRYIIYLFRQVDLAFHSPRHSKCVSALGININNKWRRQMWTIAIDRPTHTAKVDGLCSSATRFSVLRFSLIVWSP